jgi:RNA-directed DNA polymerase
MLVDFKLLQGEEDLHKFLNCRKELADWLLTATDDELFFRHEIPKKGRKGGTREVWEVQQDTVGDVYKGLARKLDDFIRAQLPGFPHNAAHAYISGRSSLTNAQVHVGSRVVLNADIKSFFRSIPAKRVRTLMRELGLTEAAAAALTKILARDDHLPLGLPTSPLLANAVCLALDERLRALVPGGRYTRYADDLSFTGPVLPDKAAVAAELEQEGFKLSDHKWRAARAGRGLYVTGLSLEDGKQPRVPKAMKRRLRLELHCALKRGLMTHLGTRYESLQSGINQIDGLISYVRGIEPQLGSKYLAAWHAVLKLSGRKVAHSMWSPMASLKVLFVVDESVLQDRERTVMLLALVVVEDIDVVRTESQKFLDGLTSDPYGATNKQDLASKGLHWNAFVPDDRTRATEWVRGLPFRCFLAMATLPNQEKETYDDLYRRLLVRLIERRLVRYDRCTIDVVIEENSKINQRMLALAVQGVYDKMAKLNARRPSTAPRIRKAAKLTEGALPLPDLVMGIFGDYARSTSNAKAHAQAVASKKKKRAPGSQAEHRFEQVRDKIRAIYDLDTGEVFSRRKPFKPW